MLFAYFVAKGFRSEDFNRGTMVGNIEQQLTVIGREIQGYTRQMHQMSLSGQGAKAQQLPSGRARE